MAATSSTAHASLAVGVLSPAHLVFTVLAALAPLTLVVAVVPLHFMTGGAAVPGAFLLAGVIMLLFATTLLQLRESLPRADSLREVIAAGLGSGVGAGAGMLALLAYNALQVSVYGALGVYGSAAIAHYGGDVSWWIIAWVALLVVTWLGLRSIQTSSRVLVLILLAEIGILCWLGAALVPGTMGSGELGEIFNPRHFSSAVAPMFTLVFGAFMGFEATLVFARETRGGRRGIRRATIFSLAFIALFYAGLTTLVTATIGHDRIAAQAALETEYLVLALFWLYTPNWLAQAMQWFLAGSAFAALLALHNIAVRYFHTLAEAGLLPSLLASTSRNHRAPWVASLLQSGVAASVLAVVLLADIDPYLGLLLWGSALGLATMVLLWALCAIACARFAWRQHGRRALPLVLQATLCGIAFSAIVGLTVTDFAGLTGAGPLVNGALLGSAALAYLLGVWQARKQRLLSPAAAPEPAGVA